MINNTEAVCSSKNKTSCATMRTQPRPFKVRSNLEKNGRSYEVESVNFWSFSTYVTGHLV